MRIKSKLLVLAASLAFGMGVVASDADAFGPGGYGMGGPGGPGSSRMAGPAGMGPGYGGGSSGHGYGPSRGPGPVAGPGPRQPNNGMIGGSGPAFAHHGFGPGSMGPAYSHHPMGPNMMGAGHGHQGGLAGAGAPGADKGHEVR